MFRITSALRFCTFGKRCNQGKVWTLFEKGFPSVGSAALSLRVSPTLHAFVARDYYSLEQAKRDLNAAMQETQNIGKGPLPILVIGGASVLPYVTIPFMCLMGGSCDPSWAFSQVAYSASILSFLGGVRYAVTLGLRGAYGSAPDVLDYRTLAPAVGPVVASWLSLLFPTPLALLTVASSLAGMAYMDVFNSPYPDWYKGLRFALTSVAVVSLMLTLLFYVVLGEKKRDYRQRKTIKEEH